MRSFFKFIAYFTILPLVVLTIFSSNIYGYFRFKNYCSGEGGLRVYESLEKNSGFLADDEWLARTAAQLQHVAFVRYKDKADGSFYDLRYLGGNPNEGRSYEKNLASEPEAPIYKWRFVNAVVPSELRLNRFGYEIYSIKSNHILAQYYMFRYSIYERAHTLFDAPSGISCFNESAKELKNTSRAITELNNIFKP